MLISTPSFSNGALCPSEILEIIISFSTTRKNMSILQNEEGKKAIIAIERMMLTAIYHMLSNGEIWNPCDLYKLDMPQVMQKKQKEKPIKLALKLLTSEGIISSTNSSLMVS